MSHYPHIRYLQGAWQPQQFPVDSGVEVAFAGRSNSGKSSAINTITARQGLARASKTPGRTQLINFFEVQPGQRLVDLPGYGFAKVPPQMKQHWQQLVNGYLTARAALSGLIIIMDARHPLTEMDWSLLQWGGERQLRCHVLLSKADKLSKAAATQTLRTVVQALQGYASAQLFSATTRVGMVQARGVIDEMLAIAGKTPESVD